MTRRLLLLLLTLAFCAPVHAEFVGADLPLTDGADDDGTGTADGWSGIPVMYGHQLPAGESVTTVRYYADDDRVGVEDELYNVVPLIVQQTDGSEDGDGFFTIWEVGPAHTPTETGENEFSWGSSLIPDDGNLYHPAALQWQQDVDDTDGGVISFNTNGEGMHYFNVDTSSYVPNEDLGEIEAELELGGEFEPVLGIHSSAAGGRHYQLNFETGAAGDPCDLNGDGSVSGADIDALSSEIRNNGTDAKFDLNADSLINQDDRTVWVKDLKNTWFGDSNLDGEFNSGDFVQVFQGGLFELDQDAGWEQGDWDGDGRFNSSDFVVAFQDGGFELGPRAATSAVPEPASVLLIGIGMSILVGQLRRK